MSDKPEHEITFSSENVLKTEWEKIEKKTRKIVMRRT